MDKFLSVVIDKLYAATVKDEEISNISTLLSEKASDFGLTEEGLRSEIDETLKMAQDMGLVTIEENKVRLSNPCDYIPAMLTKNASKYGYQVRCYREDESDHSVASIPSNHDSEHALEARGRKKYRSRSRNRPRRIKKKRQKQRY